MDKKYTRQQIIESIMHWENVLNTIDESKSSLFDAFADKFGEDVIFGNNDCQRIDISLDMIKNIYCISNDIIFNSILKTRDIKIIAYDNNNSFMSYVYAKAKSNGNLVYVDRKYIAKDGKTYFPPCIEVQAMTLRIKMPFMYLASMVIHEMIHQYTVEHGNELKLENDDSNNNKIHNPHGNEFMKMANEINETYGTTIEEKCDLHNKKKEFDNAIATARKMQESENDKNIVYSGEYIMVEKPGIEDIYVVHLY